MRNPIAAPTVRSLFSPVRRARCDRCLPASQCVRSGSSSVSASAASASAASASASSAGREATRAPSRRPQFAQTRTGEYVQPVPQVHNAFLEDASMRPWLLHYLPKEVSGLTLATSLFHFTLLRRGLILLHSFHSFRSFSFINPSYICERTSGSGFRVQGSFTRKEEIS